MSFTRIKGLSETRRLPRLGRLRLGIKKTSGGGKEYPAETDYFVCPPEVQAIYGAEPKELDIMFPVNNPEIFFPQSYKLYGGNQKLKCQGDGEKANRSVEGGGMEEVECPCEELDAKGGCSQRGNLMVLLPQVSLGGVYQLDTGSINNIIRINSYIDYLNALVGRIAMIPLKIRRVPEKVEYEGKMNTHYLLQLEFVGNVDVVNALRGNNQRVLASAEALAIEAPRISGPEADTPLEPAEVMPVAEPEPAGGAAAPLIRDILRDRVMAMHPDDLKAAKLHLHELTGKAVTGKLTDEEAMAALKKLDEEARLGDLGLEPVDPDEIINNDFDQGEPE